MLACLSFVVVYLFTEFFKLLFLPSAVFKTMQMDLYSFGMQRFELVKNINSSPVIGRVGHVEGNYMKTGRFQVSGFRFRVSFLCFGNNIFAILKADRFTILDGFKQMDSV